MGPFPGTRQPFRAPVEGCELSPERKQAIRLQCAELFTDRRDDAWFAGSVTNERLDQLDAEYRAERLAGLADATFTLGGSVCGLCGRDTDGANACADCETSIDPQLKGWV